MIQLFYGSDTMNTHKVVQNILVPAIKNHGFEVCDKTIPEIKDEDWVQNDVFILGVPTWYYGDLQSDWEAYFDHFKTVNFTGKTVALFGLGDQWGYDEWFIDGVGILVEVLLKNGAHLIGAWPTKGYTFQKSRALKNATEFHGLALDEDNQYELTQERCEIWTSAVLAELQASQSIPTGALISE